MRDINQLECMGLIWNMIFKNEIIREFNMNWKFDIKALLFFSGVIVFCFKRSLFFGDMCGYIYR